MLRKYAGTVLVQASITNQRILRKIVFSAIVCVLVSCGASYQVLADNVVIDQSNTAAISFGLSIRLNAPVGQEFTPTLTSLNFIDLITGDTSGSAGATLRVNIRLGSLAGAIVGTSGDVVLPNLFGQAFGGAITSFTFGTPVTLTPGSLYVIQPVVVSGDNWFLYGDGNTYSGGRLIVSGIPNANADFNFVEGVRTPSGVPEPTTMLLLGTGLVGITVKVRKWRKAV
jgi:hypothetical protein